MKIHSLFSITATLIASLSLSTVAMAGPPQKETLKKAPALPATIACAVETGDTVNVKAAMAAKRYADYKGNRYFFCCSDCPKAFKENPAKYAKNAHIKTPTAPAKAKG